MPGPVAAVDRAGDWMQLASGEPFYPLDARLEDIYIEDIAHALGMVCRYGGHVERFYSVAEHCVLMSRAVRPQHALAALLHDAAEAYIGDMVRPLKKQIEAYCHVDDHLSELIFTRFGVEYPWHFEITQADSRILHDERDQALKPSKQPWAAYIEALTPLGVALNFWDPEEAKRQYLHRFEELTT